MESALLVSGSEKGLQQLKPLLERLSGLQVVPVASAARPGGGWRGRNMRWP